jgi:lipoate-protein ligase A
MMTLRVLIDRPQSGARNMAVDEAIFEAVRTGAQPATLRLYAWMPACLSIGCGQRIRDVDRAALSARGWDVVRRMTGGRAVLHADELTYSLALPAGHFLAEGGIIPSYRRISAALLAGLKALGVQAEAKEGVQGDGASPVCFDAASQYEITVAGRKLIGSAQRRRGGAVCQHGSLPLHGDLGRIRAVMALDHDTASAQRGITLAEALGGRLVAWEMAAQAVLAGFRAAYALELQYGALSEAEMNESERLSSEKYGHPVWTDRR